MPRSVARPSPKDQIQRLGQRAVRACDRAAGGGEWTPNSVLAAARALDEGSRAAGVARPWPRLAASLKRIGALWLASRMQVSA